jgi:hypothetical protein
VPTSWSAAVLVDDQHPFRDGEHQVRGGVFPVALIGELRNFLVGGGLLEGINLHITEQDDWLQLDIMAVSMGSLGVLLATLSDPAELNDPNSLTCRITSADHRVGPDLWQYELIASRNPTDKSIVFAAKVRLPAADLPEVISRLRP